MTAVKKERTPRTYGGQTAAERDAARRDLLLDTAFGLVADAGWRALTIEALCRGAGLNKRYFYEAFSDLDALVAALMQRLADDALTTTLAVLAGADAATDPDVTRRAVAAFVGHLTDDTRRARVLFGAVPAGEAAAAHRAAAIRQVIATVAAEGRQVKGLADDPVVELSAAMLVGGTSQAVLDWLDGRVPGDRDAFVEDLVLLWDAIGDAAAARARGRR